MPKQSRYDPQFQFSFRTFPKKIRVPYEKPRGVCQSTKPQMFCPLPIQIFIFQRTYTTQNTVTFCAITFCVLLCITFCVKSCSLFIIIFHLSKFSELWFCQFEGNSVYRTQKWVRNKLEITFTIICAKIYTRKVAVEVLQQILKTVEYPLRITLVNSPF